MLKILKTKSSLIVRALTVLLALLLQIGFYVILGLYLQQYATGIFVALEIASFILVFSLVNDQESCRDFWIIIVLVFPVLGLMLYGAWGRKNANRKLNNRIRLTEGKLRAYMPANEALLFKLREAHPNKVQIARYLCSEGFPLYENTEVNYFSLGDDLFESLISDLRQARKCIFMEYFIIDNGEIWSEVKAVLKEKAAEGVDVRLLIDDFGCMPVDSEEFKSELRKAGIRLAVFAPVTKNVSSLSFNYRNHQKITVIDGNIGYCGGVNIADEYANKKVKYGHWKDTGVRLYGDGTWGLTSIFLVMWEITMNYGISTDYSMYLPTRRGVSDGFVQPFSDGPANNPDNPALEIYTHMINKARDYIYITTPYLVLDRRMAEDLCRAARSGVDVRIIVPHIYDKWYVYMVNVANYGMLLKNGVHIHEYTPGFIHSKTAVCDDECAVCGTINTDYRSFFLHYECGVLFSEGSTVKAIRDDIRSTLEKCEEISYNNWQKRPFPEKIVQWFLKLFAPVL